MNEERKSTTVEYGAKVGILALLGTIGLQGTMALPASENIRYSNSMFSVFVFIMLAFSLYSLCERYARTDKKEKVLAYIFSTCLSLALHFGARMEVYDNVKFTDIFMWVEIVCMAVVLPPFVAWGWNKLEHACYKLRASGEKEFSLYQIWAITFLLWMPTFFALYPGAFVYDAQDEYIEVISRTFTMHHPLLHVLALGGIVHAAEYVGLTANAGIAVYVILQMLIMSCILAYSIKMLQRWGMRKGYLVGVMLAYGLFPLFPTYAVCTAKDGLFTAFFFLIVILLIEYQRSRESFFTIKNMLLLVIASTLMMLLRNNGMYAYMVTIVIMWLMHVASRKREKKSFYKIMVVMSLSVVLYLGCNYVLKAVTVASDDEHQEMLTVPIQQITRVYTYSKDVFSDEELEILYEVLPEDFLITYRPRVSDVLKSGFNNEAYEKNPSRYRKLWLNIGLRKPLIYINAWFGTSYGYWYPDALNNVYAGNQMYSFQYGDSSYFGFETEPPGVRDSKLRVLELFYENMSLELFQQKIPVISMLFAPGFMFWILAFTMLGIMRKDDKYMPLILVGLLWLTVLLGPTTLVRYVLILWFILPLYPVLCISDER